MSKKYLCPLCNQETAYQSYGFPSSVVCKCNGLTEIGVLENGVFTIKNKTESENQKFSHDQFEFLLLESDSDFDNAGTFFYKNFGNRNERNASIYAEADVWWITDTLNPEESILFYINKKTNEPVYLHHKRLRTVRSDIKNTILSIFQKKNILTRNDIIF